MEAVRETIRDYQEDIKHILTDRQLAAEIMYDLEQVIKHSSIAINLYRYSESGGRHVCR